MSVYAELMYKHSHTTGLSPSSFYPYPLILPVFSLDLVTPSFTFVFSALCFHVSHLCIFPSGSCVPRCRTPSWRASVSSIPLESCRGRNRELAEVCFTHIHPCFTRLVLHVRNSANVFNTSLHPLL